MKKQLDLFQGNQLRDLGIKKALDNAEDKNENWGEIAYCFLLRYIKQTDTFMAEDLREASINEVPEPPSNRAWGAIIVRAKKNKLIRSIGFASVKNPKAHRAPCNVWQVN